MARRAGRPSWDMLAVALILALLSPPAHCQATCGSIELAASSSGRGARLLRDVACSSDVKVTVSSDLQLPSPSTNATSGTRNCVLTGASL